MWLDRLSGHSTPGGTPSVSRGYSPAPPRRPSHLAPTSAVQRPAFSPRTSSLSINSNDSSASLLASSRKTNVPNARQNGTTAEAPEPLKVLEKLLGHDGKDAPSSSSVSESGKSQDVVAECELDFGGLTMQELASFSGTKSALLDDFQSVEDYESDTQKFEDLHKSIRACDEVLASVETNLTSFQHDLAAVSAEIETLQARSTHLTVRLENRKTIENQLGPLVEEISISPAVVRKIVDGAIDEAWVRSLAELERKSKFVKNKAEQHKHIMGVKDLQPLLRDLINKALERIRDFMVAQIKALRSPNINAQIIQQQHFIKYKDLYAFLHSYHSQLAEEIAQAYINTMRWYFLNQFTRYQKALEKVKLHSLDKYDVLGQDDAVRRTSLLTTAKSSGLPHDAFNLGRRIDLLRTSNQLALSSFLAEEDKTTHYLEFPFRNFNLALVDNASAEYSFLTSFFSMSLSSKTIAQHFNHIFEPTFALGQHLTRSLIGDTYDGHGILLCVRLNQHFAFELQRRKVPAVDGYINATSMLLWPRFQVIMDQHCESVRTVTNAISNKRLSTAEQAKRSTAPHFITQRFGQFLHGILTLSAEAGDDEPVSASLIRLRSEVEAFLTKYSTSIGDSRKRERFLYNNYSLVLTIIGDVEGKQALEQQAHFEGLKDAFGDGV